MEPKATRINCARKLLVISQLLVNVRYSSIVLRRCQRLVLAAAVSKCCTTVACFYVRTRLQLVSDIFIVTCGCSILRAYVVCVWNIEHEIRGQQGS